MIKLHNKPLFKGGRGGFHSYGDGWEALRGVVPPVGGWKENTTYVVEVKFSSHNPPFRGYFYSGFLNGGGHCKGLKKGEQPERGLYPGGYNGFMLTDDDRLSYSDVYWMNVIAELPDLGDDAYGTPA